jgi:hypothetical protein
VNSIGQKLLPAIAATLLPQFRRAARPAHALLNCRPQETVFPLYPDTQFMYQRKETDFRTGLFSFCETTSLVRWMALLFSIHQLYAWPPALG